VYHTRSGGELQSPISREIRTLSRNPNHLMMGDFTEALLYLARERQLLEETILPLKKKDVFVITDRCFYSHLVLSVHGRGLDRKIMERLIRPLTSGIEPDMVFLCDVDITTSQVRKKIQKYLKETAPDDFGRKGLAGIELRQRVRNGFISLAREKHRTWTIVPNDCLTLDQAFSRIWAVIGQKYAKKIGLQKRPAPAKGSSYHLACVEREPAKNLKSVTKAFYQSLEGLSPQLIGYFLQGIGSDQAYTMRETLVKTSPEMLLYSLKNLVDPKAFGYFHRLKEAFPRHVAWAQHNLIVTKESQKLRQELFNKTPELVIRSLKGIDQSWAHELRLRGLDNHPQEVLISLAGIQTDTAAGLRSRLAKKKYADALLQSLAGIDTEFAWDMREKFQDTHALFVLLSLTGLQTEAAHAQRKQSIKKAPKAVAWSLKFCDDPESWALRNQCLDAYPQVLDSLKHMACPEADAIRSRLFGNFPSLVLDSMGIVYNAFTYEKNPWIARAKKAMFKNRLFLKSIVEREDKRTRSAPYARIPENPA